MCMCVKILLTVKSKSILGAISGSGYAFAEQMLFKTAVEIPLWSYEENQ